MFAPPCVQFDAAYASDGAAGFSCVGAALVSSVQSKFADVLKRLLLKVSPVQVQLSHATKGDLTTRPFIGYRSKQTF